MKTEDKACIEMLITDYMCWWDDRVQSADYATRLDGNATWERWQIVGGENRLLERFSGKDAVLGAKSADTSVVHSTSNLVFHNRSHDCIEVRAYFRTYFKSDGTLLTHGEDRFGIKRTNGEWYIISIATQHFWIREGW